MQAFTHRIYMDGTLQETLRNSISWVNRYIIALKIVNNVQGQPEDTLGCPCLLQDIQYVTSDMDSRQPVWEHSYIAL